MKKINTRFLFIFVVIPLTALLLFSCAAKKPFWGDEQSGFTVSYKLDKGQVLQYNSTADQIMSLEAMGQTMEITTDMIFKYTLLGTGINEEKNLVGKLTIDDMSMKTISFQGNTNPDVSKLLGKSFDLTFSPLGKELDFAGIEDLKIDLGPTGGGVQSIKRFFKDILSDLPDKPVKIGESWEVKDEQTEPQGTMDVKSITTAVHTLEGYETVDGFECLKIVTKATGSLQGSGEQGGGQIDMEGDVETETIWYFAYKIGVFVKAVSDIFVEGTIAISGAQDMTLPMTQEAKSEVKLVSPPPSK